MEMGVPFRAVVADSFYGEDRGFKRSLGELGVAYVLSLKKSHCWWHMKGTIGARGKEALVEAMGRALEAVCTEDVHGYFAHCGYRTPAQHL